MAFFGYLAHFSQKKVRLRMKGAPIHYRPLMETQQVLHLSGKEIEIGWCGVIFFSIVRS